MNPSMLTGLVNNTALLMALALVYDVLVLPRPGEKVSIRQISLGFVLGGIGIGVMMNPWEFLPGVIFDVRSVLLCITGYFFGLVPSLITIAITGGYRIYLGGTGTWTGVGVILTSGLIGVLWRGLKKDNWRKISDGEIYLMGIATHFVMLLWMFTLPGNLAADVLARVSLPVIVIFPLCTLLLGKLMINRNERFRFLERVKESEAKFRGFSEQSLVGIYLIQDKILQYVNPKFAEIFGYTIEECQNHMPFINLVHPGDIEKVKERVQKRLSGEIQSMQYEVRGVKKNGAVIHIVIFGSTIRYRGRPAAIGTVMDVTDHRQMEAKIRQIVKLEAVGTLAGGVAHEINNPINGIMNYAQMIKDNIEDKKLALESADEIIHETERVATIVRNLLTFAREEKEEHSPEKIRDIVEKTVSLIQTVFKKEQINITIDVSETLPLIKCRRQQIQQVMMNLVTNARDAINQRYPEYDENKRIVISAKAFKKAGSTWVRTTVEDSGTGINPEISERIFDPFFTTKERDRGTGLGLSISYGIVKDHSGELSFKSEPGQFTEFYLDLPVMEE